MFYLRYGQALNDCINNVFGSDAANIPRQTLKNAPILNAKYNSDSPELRGNAGLNNPNAGPYGTVFVASDTVFHASGPNVLNAIMGTFAHELGNILDERMNPSGTADRAYGYTYGDVNDPVDKDTGAQVEECIFGGALQGPQGPYPQYQ